MYELPSRPLQIASELHTDVSDQQLQIFGTVHFNLFYQFFLSLSLDDGNEDLSEFSVQIFPYICVILVELISCMEASHF